MIHYGVLYTLQTKTPLPGTCCFLRKGTKMVQRHWVSCPRSHSQQLADMSLGLPTCLILCSISFYFGGMTTWDKTAASSRDKCHTYCSNLSNVMWKNWKPGPKGPISNSWMSAVTHLVWAALCVRCILITRLHCPSIFPWLLCLSRSQGDFLTLAHLFRHDCWVSKEDIFGMNEIFPSRVSFPPWVMPHIHPSLCCSILHHPNSSDISPGVSSLFRLSSCLYSICLKSQRDFTS